jgi:hypothetical protein
MNEFILMLEQVKVSRYLFLSGSLHCYNYYVICSESECAVQLYGVYTIF